MPRLFSSNRERRLWIWALLVVVVIYTTLGLTPKLVGQISDVVLAGLFVACLILVGVAILTQGLRVRPGGLEMGVALGIAAVYTLFAVRLAIPERSHLMEYGVLAVLVYEAISERVNNGHRILLPAVCAFISTSLIGIIDECIQLYLPNRVFDWRDILFNILAALCGVLGMKVLNWARDRSRKA